MKKIILKESQYKRLLKHIYQPDGISCGPTCIKMVGEFFKGNIDSIEEICFHCETDNIIGTPPERMRKGLNKLKIKYIEHISEENPFESLRDVIDRGSLPILRTFTHNIPHWIVVHSYDEDNQKIFHVNDPWLGQIEYNEKELNKIWKDRDYFFFEIVKENHQEDIDEHNYSGNVNYRKYNPETDEEIVYNKLEEVFSKISLPKRAIWNMIGDFDYNLSIVAEVDGNVAGFYLLREEPIPEEDNEDYEILKNLKGLEGVALGIFKEYKNYGIGKEMIEYPKKLGFNYIWGYQLKSLENINDWLKRRKLYAEYSDLYITYQIFNDKN